MKTTITGTSVVIAAALLQLCIVGPAFAQSATRTWVSGVGDDANPCSRTAPCKTYAGAISKTAAAGEISTLDPGGFGGVTITKSITINGDSTLASILVAGTPGITVNAGPNDVVILRNLAIVGGGTGTNGINFLAGGALHVENCKIYGFTGQGIMFQPSASSGLFVSSTSMRNNVAGGIFVQPGSSGFANAVIDHVTMENNGRGVRAEDGATVSISNSVAAANVANGFVAIGNTRPVDVTIENSVSSNNGAVGVYSGGMATIKISNVTASRNMYGLQIVGGTIVSFHNNSIFGNTSGDGAPSSSISQM